TLWSIVSKLDVALLAGSGSVEGVKGRIPSRVGKRVIQSPLIGNSETTSQRSLPISKHVPSEADAWTKVVVIAVTELTCPPKPAGAKLASQYGVEFVYRGNALTSPEHIACIMHLVNVVTAWAQDKRRRQVVQFFVSGVKIPAQA